MKQLLLLQATKWLFQAVVFFLNNIMPCSIEKADERLLLYTLDVSKSFDRVLIKTVDCDVVIIATAVFTKFILSKSYGSSLAKENPLNLFQFMTLYRIYGSLFQLD